MKFIELLRTAFQSLKTNRKRSFLTIIGIMIGIAAVITILGMGDGVKKTMYDKFGNSKQGQQTTEIGYSSVDMVLLSLYDALFVSGIISGIPSGSSCFMLDPIILSSPDVSVPPPNII